MTREEKDLLLKDLCARLPYGVKCYISEANDTSILSAVLEDGENTLFNFWEDSRKIQYWHQLYISEFKPYLFPISSMTEEQEKEWLYTLSSDGNITYDTVDWCNKNNFDYRGLIPMGLAIDATGKNIY